MQWKSVAWAAVLAAAVPGISWGEEYALRFAAGQCVSLPPLELSTSHTIELWLRARMPLPPSSRPACVLSFAGVASIAVSSAGIDYWLDLGGPSPLRLSAGGLEAGRWRHVAVNFDGRRMRLFLDGRLVNARIALGQVAQRPGANSVIGSPAGAGESGFEGSIDEVRWWSRARSEDEIRADFRQKIENNQAGLAGYWTFDEGRGQLVRDHSLWGHHGIQGTTRFTDAGDPAWEDSGSPVRRPDPAYRLGFEPPGPLATQSGEEFAVKCMLSSPVGPAPPLLRGWSISVRHERLLHFLLDVSLRGTTAQAYLQNGFVQFESIDDEEGTGFIARAILDEAAPPLPASGDISIASAVYRSLSPRGGAQTSASIHYEEGLQGNAGPARNEVWAGAEQVFPQEGTLEVAVSPPVVALGFVEEMGVRVAPRGEFSVDCLLTVARNAGDGPQSWSISVKHDPAVLEILDATTSGTVVERAEAETSVFQITELVHNETGAGFLSAIILSMERPYNLPPIGEERIARARYRVREGVGAGTTTAIAYRDGLRQSGVAIENLVVFLTGASEPEKGLLPVRVLAESFVRGDLNGDLRVNMADAVWLILWLFQGGRAVSCLEAADLNDDGQVDLADPVFFLVALFQGGRRPPAPYPSTGLDPTPDGLGCERPAG